MKYPHLILLRSICVLTILCGINQTGTIVLCQEINLDSGLILYLPMNQNGEDSSTWHYQTQLKGPEVTNDRFGNPDHAYLFDGINDHITVNNDKALITSNEFTICMWAKINGRSKTEPTFNNSLFEQRNDNPGASVEIHFLAERLGYVYLGLRSSEGPEREFFQADYPGDKTWYHFAAMIDENKTISLFINGSQKMTGNLVGNGDFHSNVNRVSIGASHLETSINGAFNGAIDEVYIYNRALKLCEIEALYSGQLQDER
jgi:hypothetical protein